MGDNIYITCRNLKIHGFDNYIKLIRESIENQDKRNIPAKLKTLRSLLIALKEVCDDPKDFKFIPYEKYPTITFRYCFHKFRHDLEHYLNFTYRIIKYIDSSDLSHLEKYELIAILRASISPYELLVVFYHCSTTHAKNMKLLAEKYALFDNLDDRLLIDPSRDKITFNQTAFDSKKSIEAFKYNQSLRSKIIAFYRNSIALKQGMSG